MYDICIIGAGPIGSYTAKKMCALGHRVIVVEKKSAPGQNVCCTGIIGKLCLDLLDVNDDLVLRKANSATFFAPSQNSLTLQRMGEVAYILDRPLLNERLAAQAEASGVHFRFSYPVTAVEINDSTARIYSSHSNSVIEAKSVIIASGYSSGLTEKLGLRRINYFTIGAQAEVATTGQHGIEIYLDQSLTPGSFSWFVPTCEKKAFVGLMTNKEPKVKLDALLSSLREQNKIDSTNTMYIGEAIPLHSIATSYTNRVLVIGEAAGHIKPITGGGIYFGLLGADIAIEVLHRALNNNDVSARCFSEYQRRWKKLFGREIDTCFWLRRLCSIMTNRQIDCLFKVFAGKRLQDFIAHSDDFSFDWHGRLLLKSLKLILPFS